MVNKTKAQIARKMYGTALSNLSGGEKAAVTRAFNKQSEVVSSEFEAFSGSNSPDNVLTAKFGRPGFNGLKECLINKGTNLGDALVQAGITINPKKEGVMDKDTGATIMYKDAVKEGVIYMICPGIDSSY